jgi:hypothetical protein
MDIGYLKMNKDECLLTDCWEYILYFQEYLVIIIVMKNHTETTLFICKVIFILELMFHLFEDAQER